MFYKFIKEVVNTYNRMFCPCPVLAINEINPFLATFFVFWKKETWLFSPVA